MPARTRFDGSTGYGRTYSNSFGRRRTNDACCDSTFKNQSSGGSPLVKDFQKLADRLRSNIRDWQTDVVGKRQRNASSNAHALPTRALHSPLCPPLALSLPYLSLSAELSSSKRALILTTPSKEPPNMTWGVEIPTQPYFFQYVALTPRRSECYQ